MPGRDHRRQPPRRALFRTRRHRDQGRQHLQGPGRQRRARDPGRLRRLRRGRERIPAHLGSPPALLPRRRARRARGPEDPAPRAPADPGGPEARRRGPGAGAQGGHRHQGADAHQLPLHPRPAHRAHARHGPGWRLAQGGGRGGSPRDAEDPRHPRPPRRLRVHPPHGRAGADEDRPEARRRLPDAPLEGDGQAHQERRRAVRFCGRASRRSSSTPRRRTTA